MSDAVAHRGPDDSGSWLDEAHGIALGHRRLSIVDLSPEGHQPMRSRDGRYTIVFNGEIYNFRELRAELECSGEVFRGHSDTEVMLAQISRFGIRRALERFAGMFAFALWDRATANLCLARDRMGEKPLYYAWFGRTLLFGSELKALKQHPAWSGVIDRDSLALYVRHGYVPAPYSIFSGVRKVEPAQLLTMGGDGSVHAASYWSLSEMAERGIRSPFSEGEAVTALDEVLRRVVGEQMVADVPLGAFLSGGVDSSTVVALMRAQSAGSIKTFTIGFDDPAFDEAVHARRIARHLDTEHTELTASASDALAVVPQLASIFDEPFSDSSQIPTCLVAQLTRQFVTVSLSGDGGDESFGGYPRHWLAPRAWRAMRHVPRSLRQAVSWAVLHGATALPAIAPRTSFVRAKAQRAQTIGDVLGRGSFDSVYARTLSLCSAPLDVVSGAVEPPTVPTGRISLPSIAGFEQRAMLTDSLSYLPDDIFVKVDRATMHVGLESRAPLADHRVVETAWRMPISLLRRHPQGKWPLRAVLEQFVPRSLVERPKMGFGVPMATWLRGPLRTYAEDLLSSASLNRVACFNPAPVRLAWQEHLSGQRDRASFLWTIIMFQAWSQT